LIFWVAIFLLVSSYILCLTCCFVQVTEKDFVESIAISNDDDIIEEDVLHLNSTTTKGKKTLKSKVWNFFDILPIGADQKLKSHRKKCEAQYLASSKYGTSNIRRHIKVCKRNDTRDISQMMISRDTNNLSLSGN